MRHLIRSVRVCGSDARALSLLFHRYPVALSSLLNEDLLEGLADRGRDYLDDFDLGVLASEIAFRNGRSARLPARLAPLKEPSPFSFPIILKTDSSVQDIFRPAVVALYKIRGLTEESRPWEDMLDGASALAIRLADAMIPGTEHPWVTPHFPDLAEKSGGASAGLAFFFASACYLLSIPYPREVLCSAQFVNGLLAGVSGIDEKAKIAAKDGFRYFVVCGPSNRLEAEAALENLRRRPKIIALRENASAPDIFLELIEKLDGRVSGWSLEDRRELVSFLFGHVRNSARLPLAHNIVQLEKIHGLLSLLPDPCEDERSDALRLDILLESGKENERCRHFETAAGLHAEVETLTGKLLARKRCPANFEDAWYALPLRQGILAMHRYEYKKAEKFLAGAEASAKKRFPPSTGFRGLVLQAMGRLDTCRGLSDRARARRAVTRLANASRMIDAASRLEHACYTGEALANLGKFDEAFAAYRPALKGTLTERAHALSGLVRAHVLRGFSEELRNDLTIAVRWYSDFVSIEQDHATACCRAGTASWRALAAMVHSGPDAALSLFEKAAAMTTDACGECADPTSLHPILWQAFLAQRCGRDQALQSALRTLSGFAERMTGPPDGLREIFRLLVRAKRAEERTIILKSLLSTIHGGAPDFLFPKLDAILPD